MCNKFLKDLLKQTLPVLIDNPARINGQFWGNLTSHITDSANDQFLAYVCSVALKLPGGSPISPPKVPLM